MDATTLTLIGCAFGLIALVIAWSQLHPAASCVEPGWLRPPWSASTGSGSSNSAAPKLNPRPRLLTVEHIEGRRAKIVRWLRRFGVPSTEEEDLVQRVVGEAWRARDTYRPDLAEVDTWLYSVTRNWASNYVNSAWARRIELQDLNDGSSAIVVADATPETALEHAELVQIAWTILARLPPRLAEIWTRYEVDGEEARDIAVALGIPLSTIWGRLQQARDRITREVEREGAIEAHAARRR